MNSNCKTCGKSFIANNTSHKYCKPECRKSFVVRKDFEDGLTHSKTCPNCFNEFVVDKSNPTRKYCSAECRVEFFKCPKTDKTLYEIDRKSECKHCRVVFSYISYADNRKFCKAECRNAYHRNKKIGSNFNCLWCNKSVEYDPKKASRKFCEEKCRTEHHKSNKKDKPSSHDFIEMRVKEIFEKMRSTSSFAHLSINTSNLTLSSFTDSLRQQILDRDGNTCQVCGVSMVRLEIHHILKRRLGGSNESDNLITLCVKCHRAIDTYDEDYAIKKCIKNFHALFDENIDQITTQQKVTSSSFLLSEIFDKLSCDNIGEEYSEILIKIDELLSYIDG